MNVGASPIRIDAHAKVTGDAQYPGDRAPADALAARVVFTDQPHARLLRLDVSAAEQMPGVVAVFTGRDVPVNEYGLTEFDQPVFISVEHTGRSKVDSDISRWEADHLALVVAETDEQARAAAAVIEAEWEQLPIVADIDQALAPDASLVHPELGLASNIYHTYKIRKGSIDDAWAEAAVIVEQHLRTALPGARLPTTGSRRRLHRRRRSRHGRGRRAMDPRGPGADRPCARPPGRPCQGDLPGDRWGVRRARRQSLQIVLGAGLDAAGRTGRTPCRRQHVVA